MHIVLAESYASLYTYNGTDQRGIAVHNADHPQSHSCDPLCLFWMDVKWSPMERVFACENTKSIIHHKFNGYYSTKSMKIKARKVKID